MAAVDDGAAFTSSKATRGEGSSVADGSTSKEFASKTDGDWPSEDAASPQRPTGGTEMPSGAQTPSPMNSPRTRYRPANSQGNPADASSQQDDGMCIDSWEWKTDVPEFVPTVPAVPVAQVLNPAAPTFVAPWVVPTPTVSASASAGATEGTAAAPWVDGQKLSEICGQCPTAMHGYEWQLQTKVDELTEMQSRMNQLKIETAQARASWEAERRSLVRQIGHYRAVLERYWIPIEEAGPDPDTEDYQYFASSFENSSSTPWANVAVNDAPHAPAAGACAAAGMGVAEEASTDQNNSSLDSKMKQLQSILQEPEDSANKSGDAATSGRHRSAGSDGEANGFSSGSIASTLRAMFPHATIRTRQAGEGKAADDGEQERPERYRLGSDPEEREVEGQLKALETSTKSQVDDRALRAFQSLSNKDAREAVGKVEELVRSQGGHCRNLSSILQSVCRKIERRSAKPQKEIDDTKKIGRELYETPQKSYPLRDEPRGVWGRGIDSKSGGTGASSAARPAPVSGVWSHGARARQLDEDADAFDSTESDEQKKESTITTRRLSKESSTKNSMGKRSSGTKSWADIQSGDEDDGREEEEGLPFQMMGTSDEADDPWTMPEVEKAAKKGFELRRRGEFWNLKIYMSNLEPAFTEAAMEKYCRWLSQRLESFKEENGAGCLQKCRAEVDFSHNNMSNQMVWTLLQALSEHEVQTALLKLYANRISQGGVLSICEFIRTMAGTEGLHELHLSHNEIEDESALELLRTLHQARPRYPPKRLAENSRDWVVSPVWLRLNHNRIRNPTEVLEEAEADGISICNASDRQECGTSKCSRAASDCPLVHLYSFNVQDLPKDADEGRRNAKRRDRKVESDWWPSRT
eukprot:CAMPEP_0178422940 /NCGR_PEP_ID=MMETSP0689_2-20121128/27434_1 /TAXON_ID=160604 /ORGANISM="Amphidinium massartii, Strain CS-259" /LENGTH=866 /DNA_ID=CAMNT_0020044523 /DNA_START=54 /DNA_END=2654 /DNA_ORIENTATION=-